MCPFICVLDFRHLSPPQDLLACGPPSPPPPPPPHNHHHQHECTPGTLPIAPHPQSSDEKHGTHVTLSYIARPNNIQRMDEHSQSHFQLDHTNSEPVDQGSPATATYCFALKVLLYSALLFQRRRRTCQLASRAEHVCLLLNSEQSLCLEHGQNFQIAYNLGLDSIGSWL